MKPKFNYFTQVREAHVAAPTSQKPDFGIVTPDACYWGERGYMRWLLPINTQRGDRADDWMERMRSHGAHTRAREDLKNAHDYR